MEAEAILKEARGLLARILDVSAGEIVFTSGGTESNTCWPLKGRRTPGGGGDATW